MKTEGCIYDDFYKVYSPNKNAKKVQVSDEGCKLHKDSNHFVVIGECEYEPSRYLFIIPYTIVAIDVISIIVTFFFFEILSIRSSNYIETFDLNSITVTDFAIRVKNVSNEKVDK